MDMDLVPLEIQQPASVLKATKEIVAINVGLVSLRLVPKTSDVFQDKHTSMARVPLFKRSFLQCNSIAKSRSKTIGAMLGKGQVSKNLSFLSLQCFAASMPLVGCLEFFICFPVLSE